MTDAHYSLKINPLFSMKNAYIALENNQVTRPWIFLFLLKVDCIGTHNQSKCSQQHQWSLLLKDLGPDHSCGVNEELDLPFLESSQSLTIIQTKEHVAKRGMSIYCKS